jgi:hypothetical protein
MNNRQCDTPDVPDWVRDTVFYQIFPDRYNTHDYYQVDPLLGGTPALRALLDVCHARGMKVMLDGVFRDVLNGLSARVEHQRFIGDNLPARSGSLFRQVSGEVEA